MSRAQTGARFAVRHRWLAAAGELCCGAAGAAAACLQSSDLQQSWVVVEDAPQVILQGLSAAGPACCCCCSHRVQALKYEAGGVHQRRFHAYNIGDYLIRQRLDAMPAQHP